MSEVLVRIKKKWKYDDDVKLVEALLDMVNLGAYKADNGFKPGYLNYIEDKLKVSLPDSGFKAKPHIESRIRTLKKDFNIVYDMLNGPNTSGFGMDPMKKCVTAEKQVWDAYLQSHPTHSTWRNKNFPFYDDLLIVFGKDRATGVNAEGPANMVEDIQSEKNNHDENNNVEDNVENILDGFDDPISPLLSPKNEAVHKKKKRRKSEGFDNLKVTADIKEAASIIGSEIANASQVLCKAIGVDAEISEKRKKIDSEIRKSANLTTSEVIKAVCHIARSHELIDVFFSMTEEGREELVMVILNGDI